MSYSYCGIRTLYIPLMYLVILFIKASQSVEFMILKSWDSYNVGNKTSCNKILLSQDL